MFIKNFNTFNNFVNILKRNGYEGEVMKENFGGKDGFIFSFGKLIDDPKSKMSMLLMVNSGEEYFTNGLHALYYLKLRFENSQDQDFGLPEELQRLNVLEGEFIVKTATKFLGI